MAIDLEKIRDHLVVEHFDDDHLINAYWQAAIDYCEGLCANYLVSAPRSKVFANFEASMVLGKDVTAIDSITYLDDADAEQTLDPVVYRLFYNGYQYWVILADDQEWPIDATHVTVSFTAGKSEPTPAVEQAILMTIGHLYQNRETTSPGMQIHDVPHSVESLLRPYSVRFL